MGGITLDFSNWGNIMPLAKKYYSDSDLVDVVQAQADNQPNAIPPAPQATQQPPQGMIPPPPQQAQMPPQQMPQQMPQQQMPPPQIPNQQVLAMGQGPLNQQAAQQQMPPPPQHWQSLSSAQPPAQMQNPSAIPPKAPAQDSQVQPTAQPNAQQATIPSASEANAYISHLPAELQPMAQDVHDTVKSVEQANKDLLASKNNPQNILKWAIKNNLNQKQYEQMVQLATPAFHQEVGNFNELRQVAAQKATEFQKMESWYSSQGRLQLAQQHEAGVASRASGTDGSTITYDNAKMRVEDAIAAGHIGDAFQGIGFRDNKSRALINKAFDEYAKTNKTTGVDIAANKIAATGETAAIRSASTTGARVGMFAAETEKLLGVLNKSVDKLDNSKFKDWNAVTNWANAHASDPSLNELATNIIGVENSYAKAVAGGGAPTQAERDAIHTVLDKNVGKYGIKGAIKAIESEMKAIVEAPREQRAKMLEEFSASRAPKGKAGETKTVNWADWK